MLYTIKGDQVEIVCFILDIIDHPEYDKKFKYKGRYGNNMLYGYLQSYAEIQSNKERFGEVQIRKLLKPSTPFSREVVMSRKINP